MKRAGLLALLAGIFLTLAGTARATTLVNDSAHPFSPVDWGLITRWVGDAHVPLAPGTVLLSNQPCEGGTVAAGATLPIACSAAKTWTGMEFEPIGHTWIPGGSLTRDVVLHEMGRLFNFHATGAQQTALMAQFHVKAWADPAPETYTASDRVAGENVSADAYAKCAELAHWRRWWAHTIRLRPAHGSLGGAATVGGDTPYNFRAGPARFARICAIYRAD